MDQFDYPFPRTTRRVTAQRKFAQGAYVPPVAATATTPSATVAATATAERRDAPSCNDNRSNVFHNNMPARNLLDVVCFQYAHTHIQPIVLLERLAEKRQSNEYDNNALLTVRRSVPVRLEGIHPKVVHKPSVHGMRLRARKKPPQKKKKPHTTRKRRQPTYISLPLRDYQPPRKYARNRGTTTPSDFSLDDNKPLTYFVRDCISPEPSPTHHLTDMGPPSYIPPLPPPTPGPSEISVERPPSFEKFEMSLPSIAPSVSSISTFIVPPVPQKDPGFISAYTVSRRYFDELGGETSSASEAPQPSPSPVPEPVPPVSNVNETPATATKVFRQSPRSRSYYTDHSIRKWMDYCMQEDTPNDTPNAAPNDTHNDTGSNSDDDVLMVPVTYNGCVAGTWRTARDATCSGRSALYNRCKKCTNCETTDKLMHLTALLIKQTKIEALLTTSSDGSPVVNWDDLAIKGTNIVRSSDDLYTELLPQHPYLMIKIYVTEADTKVYNACLIPRSEFIASNEFVLFLHAYMLDQLLDTLSLSLDEPFIKGESPAKDGASTSARPARRISLDSIAQEKLANAAAHQSLGSSGAKKNEEEQPRGKILDAPTFWPTAEEFRDPFEYFKTIRHIASKYGICKIVPPHGFVPPCKADDEIRFEVTNQYISRLYTRWGAAAREICAIKASLKPLNISYTRPPVIDGIEINLPQLYHVVQRHGGLQTVINKNKWGKVLEDMHYPKNPLTERKLDQLYVKYLLPYDTLSAKERQNLLRKVEQAWMKKCRKLLERANNPLHKKKRLLGDSDSSGSETEDDETDDAEDCVKPGVSMNMAKFKKVARSVFDYLFRNKAVNTQVIEDEYWRTVILGHDHICVNTAAIDTGKQNLGFSKSKTDSYKKHPWNLKVLSQDARNVLRSLGQVLGVTVPTLHLGMAFSTNCWHRDPHSIYWMEFEHTGPTIIRYGIPESGGEAFRKAAEMLSPTSCQNKPLWLPSDIAMIPPSLLAEHNVNVYRVEQNPGEFVLVMPRAYSCSISTGYTVTESVYFATDSWLDTLKEVFEEINSSCEPTMFALDQLLKSIVEDQHVNIIVLNKIKPLLDEVFKLEIENRKRLAERGIKIADTSEDYALPSTSKGKRGKAQAPSPTEWNFKDGDECEVCRRSLYLSKVINFPHKDTMLCLEHALEALDKEKYANFDISQVEMHYRFSTDELEDTMLTLEVRLQEESED